jgi:hypothetical protein
MKNLVDFVAGLNPYLLVTGAILIVLLLVAMFSLIKKIFVMREENKQQNHPMSFGVEHTECFFKILKIDEKKGIIYLGYNPSIQHPFGIGGGWFKIDKIPVGLRNEYSVLKVKKGLKDEVIFYKGPIF